MKYQNIHSKIHELEALIAQEINAIHKTNLPAAKALENAHDTLVHQVAEWVRTAENKLEK